MAASDPFARLYLLPTAPPEVVDAAHRALVKLLHPDVSGDATTAQMADVNAAYDAIKSGIKPPPSAGTAPPPAAQVRMPWGKHRGQSLAAIPSDYLVWVLDNAAALQPGLRADISDVLVWRRFR